MTFCIEVPAPACTPSVLSALREILHSHEGYEPVRVNFRTANGTTPLELGRQFSVDGSQALHDKLTRFGLITWVEP